jgi:protease-4
MNFVGKVWKILVGIKDGLVLLFMLLFFIGLFAVLSARPHPGTVREGALLLALEGVVVEEKSLFDPVETLLSGTAPVTEYRARDIIRALDAAATDPRIKVVVLDLSTFLGGGQVHLTEIGEAMDRVRKAKKPVLAFARGYADDHMLLAAHASEVWLDPQGLAIIAGPGGTNLYYAELLDRLSIKAHVYRVGTFKSAVEPWSRNSMSDEARANIAGVLGALWEEYRANLAKARPRLALGKVTGDVIGWIGAAGGDLADAALAAGLVDKLGDRIEFGERVAEIVGKPPGDETPGAFAASELDSYLADLGPPRGGKAIGVVTIAGEIVDGEAGPGIAGGKRIADMLDAALAQDLAALVVRVDSPGGSATAAEEIRRAIDRHRQRKIPVAVSFANLAASGGYWVAMASDRIFAQPATVTGSIGVFAVVPTFEGSAARLGIRADGYRTTPLSGQPDIIGGFSPEMDAVLQGSISATYRDFVTLVAKGRKLAPEKVEAIAEGRVWDGGAARQIGLVDAFGGLDDALAWTAAKAGLKEDEWHPVFLGAADEGYDSLIRKLLTRRGTGTPAAQAGTGGDIFALVAARNAALGTRLVDDLQRLLGTRGAQALCLECPALPAARQRKQDEPTGLLALLAALAGR